VSSLQYFVAQVIAASAWEPPYSWRLNAISDLGAVGCGPFDGRSVCSPSHGLMNASFILLGVAMAVGAVLFYREFCGSRIGFSLMVLAGVGAILVGVFPEDTTYSAHIAGADLAFLLGNVALIVLGRTLRVSRWFLWYSIVSGAVALVALVLFLTHHRFFLELGGMERLVAYPQTVWLVAFAMLVLWEARSSDASTRRTGDRPRLAAR
jgi:hypothetical membrane protein